MDVALRIIYGKGYIISLPRLIRWWLDSVSPDGKRFIDSKKRDVVCGFIIFPDLVIVKPPLDDEIPFVLTV